MRHWLFKSEPASYGIDELARDGRTHWDGIRNYQARNFLRDDVAVGDLVVFWHSNAEPPGAVGLAKVVRAAYPDPSQFDPDSKYYDEKAKKAAPPWVMVDIAFVEKWPATVPLAAIKDDPLLAGVEVARKGSRLSVQPLSPEHFERMVALGRGAA